MMQQTVDALREFTARYCDAWQQRTGHAPASQALYGVPSPCIIATQADEVWWQPQPFTLPATLEAVERALEITLQEDIAVFYTTQFAGDMTARCAHLELSLLQVWSEEDFLRLQENLIGHLIMKRRLKQTPTLFIAATESEQEIVSICNLTGEVILEQPGTKKREILAENAQIFLKNLQVVMPGFADNRQ
ncbi:MAG: SecY-interacting protein [Mixta calida]|uniref:SecY-interacting protein n=1 Tax=Pantoea TaxID=53335 RepID=UPI000660F8EB|nr:MULTISPECIES: SecY-interacting protein [Pantoea]MDU2728726.1 SecY-interacting protein [Pantoea sp.]MDU2734660.1 SecY-interacting protein [Mixta calida]